MTRDVSTEVTGLQPELLDHASEFVSVVYRRAPECYRDLVDSDRFRLLLGQDNAFNHGKLYAYAEYRVFRSEFLERFPGASSQACINAFSKLFLKNDISITNLVDAIEGAAGQELLFIQGKESPVRDGG
jgi:hypothetical protein